MSEGEAHSRLVAAMLGAIRKSSPEGTLDIWADQSHTREYQSPFVIGEAKADVIAIRRDTRFVVIGEAKTRGDIDNLHTRTQLKEFYEHLLTQPGGLLWFSVPLGSGGEGLRVAKTVRNENRCEHVGLIVSEWLLGTSEFETRWHG